MGFVGYNFYGIMNVGGSTNKILLHVGGDKDTQSDFNSNAGIMEKKLKLHSVS